LEVPQQSPSKDEFADYERPTFNVLVFMSPLITVPVTVTDYYGAAEDSLTRRHNCCQAKCMAACSPGGVQLLLSAA
jgi:hypothetical protein